MEVNYMSGQSTVDTVEDERVSVAQRIANIEGEKFPKDIAIEPEPVEAGTGSELEPVEEGQEPAESPELQQTTEDDLVAPKGGFNIPDSTGEEEIVAVDMLINDLNISEFSRVLEAAGSDPEFRTALAVLLRNGPTIHMAGLSELYKDVVPQEEELSAEEQAELAEKAAAEDEIEESEPTVVAEEDEPAVVSVEGENPTTETDEPVAETSVVAEESEPAVVSVEGENPTTETDEPVAETSVVAEEDEPAVVAAEGENLTTETDEPVAETVVAEENEPAVVAAEGENPTTKIDEPVAETVVAEENEPAVPEALEPPVSPVVTFSGEGTAAATGVSSVAEDTVEEQGPANDPAPAASSVPSPAM